MAETATLARPYAEAVFRLADSGGRLAAWSGTLARMAQVAAHPDMQACIGNPNLGSDKLYGLFASLSGEAVFAPDASQLQAVFDMIAAKVLYQ